MPVTTIPDWYRKLGLLGAAVASLALGAILSSPLWGQVQFVGEGYFPAPQEFKEIKSVESEKDLKDEAELVRLDTGPVLREAGLRRYGQRIFALDGPPGSMTVTIYTFGDARGAYSALTLYAKSQILSGPPGDFSAPEQDALLFVAGNNLIRIQAAAAKDLARRVAASIMNRIGNHESKAPSLIRHLPADGCDPSSSRYFLGPSALDAFGKPVAGAALSLPADVEVAQARCAGPDGAGTFTLLGFPTIQMAQDYFDSPSLYERGAAGTDRLYTRQTGPLLAILEGNFPADAADKVLGSLSFSYAIKWIYEKNKPSRTIWGVPVRILGTVVRSIAFTALLCLMSIFAGILLATARVYARKRWTRFEERSSYIRLKLDED